MTAEFIKQLQNKYLGKTITIPFVREGKIYNEDTITGICNFIGPNSHLPKWELQITIDRTPISNVDYTKIKLKDVK